MKRYFIILSFLMSFNYYIIPGLFQLNPDELAALNLSPEETKLVEEAFQEINKMSPEEQKKFAETLQAATQEIETKMRSKGLDPANPQDVQNFMNNYMSELTQQEPIVANESKEELPKSLEDTARPMPMPKAVQKLPKTKAPANLTALIQSILSHLAQLRQKVQHRPVMQRQLGRWSQELYETVYYLNRLADPKIIVYLEMPEFAKLRQDLQTLHTILQKNEPQIAILPEINNPYKTLGLHFVQKPTPTEIDNAFNKLKETESPQSKRTELIKAGIKGDELTIQVKAAEIIFSMIEDAYTDLKDPVRKAQIDKALQHNVEQALHDQQSRRAFNKIIEAINTSLYNNKLVTQIKQLLKKYEPEEIKLAKAHEEAEKRALTESKQQKIVLPKIIPATPERNFEAFYRQQKDEELRAKYREAFSQSPYNIPMGAKPAPIEPSIRQQAGGSAGGDDKGSKAPEQPNKPGEKKESKPSGPGKDSGGEKTNLPHKSGSEAMPEKAKGGIPLSKEKLNKAKDSISKLKYILKDSSETIDIPAAEITRSPEEKPVTKKTISLKELSNQLESYIVKPISRTVTAESQSPELLQIFAEKNKFKQLSSQLGKLQKLIGDASDPELKELWQNAIVNKYGYKITEWYKQIYEPLDINLRSNNNKPNIHSSKLTLYNILGTQPKKTETDITVPDLSVIKKAVGDLYTNYSKISKALGITGQPKPPKEKKK